MSRKPIALLFSLIMLAGPSGVPIASAVLSGSQVALAPRSALSTYQSSNWSGYAVTGSTGSVTSVKGSWTVPLVQGTCPATKVQYAAFWVGIDGFTSSTVEQTGTDSDCLNGVPTYYAWYEFYPHPSSVITSIAVHPGDTISATVSFGTRFRVTITDLTTGQSFSTSAKVSSAQRSSAEWIAEAPSSSGGILPLADFGTVNFGSDATGVKATDVATVGGSSGPIGSFGSAVQSITMVTGLGAVKAQPSTLSSDGTSFSVTWVHAGP